MSRLIGWFLSIVCLPAIAIALNGPSKSPLELTQGAQVVEGPNLESYTKAFAENVRSQLAMRLAVEPKDISVDVESVRVEGLFDVSHVKSVQVLGLDSLSGRRMEGLFLLPTVVSLSDKAPGKIREVEVQASGLLRVTGPVWVAKKALPRGHVLEDSDLVMTRLPWRVLPTGSAALPKSELVGRRVKSLVSAGSPFQPMLLDEPFAVKTGEMIEITVLSGPGVFIRSRGVSKGEGRVGDVIRVHQPESKKMLSGVVTGDKAVEVRL
jgi:flagella basal body P-ring formation protein FlgA